MPVLHHNTSKFSPEDASTGSKSRNLEHFSVL